MDCVITAAKLKRKPNVLKRYGLNFEQEIMGRSCDEPSVKWGRFLRGVLVGSEVRAALCKCFTLPFLTLTNPLWSVLFRLEGVSHDLEKPLRHNAVELRQRKLDARIRRRLERLADSVRINNRPVTECSLKPLQWLASGNWPSLSLLLVLLASCSRRFEAQRDFLSRRFTLIFFLTCLNLEWMSASRLLFEVVDHLMRRHVLGPVQAWPSSMHQFKRRLKNLRQTAHKLQRQPGMAEKPALHVLQALIIELDAYLPGLTDLEVCAADTRRYKWAPEFPSVFRRWRKQTGRKANTYFCFTGLALDPKVVQGWQFAAHATAVRPVDAHHCHRSPAASVDRAPARHRPRCAWPCRATGVRRSVRFQLKLGLDGGRQLAKECLQCLNLTRLLA